MSFTAKILGGAIVAGLGIGLAPTPLADSLGNARAAASARSRSQGASRAGPPRAQRPSVRAALGPVRARPPQPGDSWPGCNDARAAGTAPIYRGEPGYSPKMDGDNDGVACEPYHGR